MPDQMRQVVVSPPWIAPTWPIVGNSNTLSVGARGPNHIQTLAFVGGNSPSPMQRLGLAPMYALGILAPDANEASAGIGARFPAAESVQLISPILTTDGRAVTYLASTAYK